MGERLIEAALREATDTQNVNIGVGALTSVPDVFLEAFGDSPAVVVADENTFEVAGKVVHRRLERAGHTMIEPYIFPAEPPLYAEYSNIEKLRDSMREHGAIPVAVGSGTINDIVKRSAHECERPYMCFATAASMDGYTAFGASIEKEGLKQTLAKYISAGELAQRLELLRDVWPGLREKVRVQLMPAEQIREMLQAAGCPTGPVEIGLRWEEFEATYLRARTIRKRYTVLDLAFEAGILEECVDELFAPDGFWGRAAASHARADEAGSFRRSDEA
jgi:glycerol dehydrogenase-like iron-containing ADH family enzyme